MSNASTPGLSERGCCFWLPRGPCGIGPNGTHWAEVVKPYRRPPVSYPLKTWNKHTHTLIETPSITNLLHSTHSLVYFLSLSILLCSFRFPCLCVCVRVCVCVFLCNGVSEDLNPKGMLLMHCYGKPRHKSRDLCHGYLWSTFDTPYNCQKVTWLMFGHLLNEIPATSNTCRPGSRSVGLGFLQNLMWNTTEASYTEFSSVSHTQFGIVSLLLGWCMRKSTALNCGEPQRMTCGAAFSLSHNWRPAWFQSGSTDSSDHKVYVWYSGPLDFHLEGENIITAPGLLANAFFQCMLLSVAQLKESKLNYFTWQMLPAKFIMTTV